MTMIELNTPESQFLFKLIEEKSLKQYFDAQTRGIAEDTFIEEVPQKVWTFIKDYSTQYSRMPTLRAVQEQVPLFTPGPVPDQFDYYRDKLIKQDQRVKLSGFARSIARMVQENDPNTLEYIGQTYQGLLKGIRLSDFGRFREMMDRIREYERKAAAGEAPLGIPTGIPRLDDHFLGFRPGDYGVISGRTGEGKTTLALFMAHAAFMAKYKVSYITLEMPREQLFEKLDALETGISIDKIKRLNLTPQEISLYQERAGIVSKEPTDINIHDRTGACSVLTVEAILNQDEPDILFVDSIYLMKGSSTKNKWEKVQEISNQLKQLAMKYRRPIIVLSQINREGATSIREGNLPALDNLSYSDSLGQDADHAFVITSNEKTKYYNAKRLSTMKLRGASELDIAVKWDPKTNRISYLEDYAKLRTPDVRVDKILQAQQNLDLESIPAKAESTPVSGGPFDN